MLFYDNTLHLCKVMCLVTRGKDSITKRQFQPILCLVIYFFNAIMVLYFKE